MAALGLLRVVLYVLDVYVQLHDDPPDAVDKIPVALAAPARLQGQRPVAVSREAVVLGPCRLAGAAVALVAGPAARPPRHGAPAGRARRGAARRRIRRRRRLPARRGRPVRPVPVHHPARELVGAEVADQHAELLVQPGPGIPLGGQLFPEGRDQGRRAAARVAILRDLRLRAAQPGTEVDVGRPQALAVAACGPVHRLDKIDAVLQRLACGQRRLLVGPLPPNHALKLGDPSEASICTRHDAS